MDSPTPHLRVKNILYTTISSETTKKDISISLFKRHSKYLKTLYVDHRYVARYSKIRTIKRLHSLEMPKVQNQGQFNHLYKLLKPQKYDVSLKRIGLSSDSSSHHQSLFRPTVRTNLKSLELNIIKLLRNSFKISSLMIFYLTDHDLKISIGRMQHRLVVLSHDYSENKDFGLLFKLNSLKKLLGPTQSVKLHLSKRDDRELGKGVFANILRCQNIITNTTMIDFKLNSIEHTAQFLSYNCMQLQRLSTISLGI